MNMEDEEAGIADALMRRGEYYRKLREADETARQEEEANKTQKDPQEAEDTYVLLPSGETALKYDSYLSHQRYYDDLKHIDAPFIDYGFIRSKDGGGGNLIVEQQKCLGKGGLCWDAAFILGEHLIATESTWNSRSRVVELGSGTGLCGLMIAKAVSCSVMITDLPDLLPLMERNIERNFSAATSVGKGFLKEQGSSSKSEVKGGYGRKQSMGFVESRVLRWGSKSDYENSPYDVVIGADVVASLYDPIALAETFHALCGKYTKVFVSYKGRLKKPHTLFEQRLKGLFQEVHRIKPESRNKNPDVCVIEARGKININDS